MTELETLKRAKMYIDKLANGKNPLNDTILSEDDIVNNVRISRCLFYVSDILRKVIENGGNVSQPKIKKADFSITQNELESFDYSGNPIPVTEIANRINAIADIENSKKFNLTMITNWLIDIDMLCEVVDFNGKKRKQPTENGEELGISIKERTGRYGTYKVVLYDLAAQHFIIDNMFSILDFYKQNKSKENQDLPWNEEQDKKLIEMYEEGASIKDISITLKRTEGTIRSHLEKLEHGD